MNPPSFRERIAYDAEAGTLRDGDIPYILIRSDALMSIFKRLSGPARAEALEAFADSVFEHGGRSAATYRARGGAEGDRLLAVIAATAPQLGWGRWSFAERTDDSLRLEVRNSPFAAGHGASDVPVCAPIVGMLRAVSSMVLGAPTVATEIACAAQGHASCRFLARRG